MWVDYWGGGVKGYAGPLSQIIGGGGGGAGPPWPPPLPTPMINIESSPGQLNCAASTNFS